MGFFSHGNGAVRLALVAAALAWGTQSLARAQEPGMALLVDGPGATTELGFVAQGALAAQGLPVAGGDRARSVVQATFGTFVEAPTEPQAIALRTVIGSESLVVVWAGAGDESGEVPVVVWVAHGSGARRASGAVPAAELTARIPQLLASVPAVLRALAPAEARAREAAPEPATPAVESEPPPPAPAAERTAPEERVTPDATSTAAGPNEPFVRYLGEAPEPAGGWDGGRVRSAGMAVTGAAVLVGGLVLWAAGGFALPGNRDVDSTDEILSITGAALLVSGLVYLPWGLYLFAAGQPGPPESSGARFGLGPGVGVRGTM